MADPREAGQVLARRSEGGSPRGPRDAPAPAAGRAVRPTPCGCLRAADKSAE